jgi:hypothetical protein
MAIDPEITDVIDPVHSTENVCSLITSLLREAGGIMIMSALRGAVLSQGGFTIKQWFTTSYGYSIDTKVH